MTGSRDRRTGLVLFGALLIATGAFCALMTVVLAGGGVAMGPEGTPAGSPYTTAAGGLLYGLLAVMFVWLGVGSALARRWAPPLILTVAWLWLVSGVLGVAMTVAVLPTILGTLELQSGPIPDTARTILVATIVSLLGVVLVAIPAVLVLFYRSPHVAATCAARDPVPRWTDGRSTSLIGLSVSLALLAGSLVPSVLLYNGLALVFGAIVTGAPGIVVNVAFALLWAWCAWSTLKLQSRGWWLTLVSFSLFTAAAVVTLALRRPAEILAATGLPVEQTAMDPAIWSRLTIGIALACWLSLVGYLLYVKRQFDAVR